MIRRTQGHVVQAGAKESWLPWDAKESLTSSACTLTIGRIDTGMGERHDLGERAVVYIQSGTDGNKIQGGT